MTNRPPRFMNFSELIALIGQNALAAARQAKQNHETLTRRKYETGAVGVGIARQLRDDLVALTEFYQNPFWKDRDNTPNPTHVLAHVLMFIYGADSSSEAQRARSHAIALREVFEGDMALEEIPDHIARSGGFDGLQVKAKAAKAVAEKAPIASRDIDSDSNGDIEPPTVANAVVPKESGSDVKKLTANARIAEKRANDPLKGMTRSEIADHLLVRWTDAQRRAILRTSVGATVDLTITRLDDDVDGFAVFTISEFA